MSYDALTRLALPFLFALGAAAAAAMLRGFGSVRRLQLWSITAGLSLGALLAVTGTGVAYEPSIRRALVALTALAGAAAFLRVIDLLVWEWLLEQRRQIQVPRLVVDLLKLLVLVAVGLAILKFDFGLALSGLLVTSTVLSAIVGLAIQDMLGNVASGIALQVERPFSVGDWVLILGREGVVTQLNWRSLTIRTRDGNAVVFPNAAVAKSEFANFSRPSRVQRLHAHVGVAYRHPPGLVKDVLARAAASVPDVLASPPVEVLVVKFADFAIEYDVRFWIVAFDRAPAITDQVLSRIWYELRRADLAIPFPVREVTMRTVSEEQEAAVEHRRRREIFAVLRALPLFSPLSDDQIDALVSGAELRAYTAGETLVRQGDRGASLFVLRSGRVRIEKAREDGGPAATVDTIERGDFFGEMSLLTGEPRTASIVAESETEVVVVDKEAFAPVLASDTAILDGLTAALEARVRNAAARLPAAARRDEERKIPSQHAALLQRVRRFFGIDETAR